MQTLKLAALASVLLTLVCSAQPVMAAPSLPATITLQASGLTGSAEFSRHNGAYTLQRMPGYPAFYRYLDTPTNPSVCWGVTIGSNRIDIVGGAGQFNGVWTAKTGDIWSLLLITGPVGTNVLITPNP